MEVSKLVEQILEGKVGDLRESFDAVMLERIRELVENEKPEVSASFFEDIEYDAEEDQ